MAMNELKVFEHLEYGKVRTITQDGEPWFCAADVCKTLEIGNPSQALKRLDEDDHFTTLISNDGAATGMSSMAFVNESGLYTLVMGSRKPEARAFRRWITRDVIPSIRRYGMFATDGMIDKMLDDPDLLITTLQKLKAEREKRLALVAQIVEDAPFTTFARSIANSSDAIYVGDFAKLVCNSGINIGRTRLFRWLRENSYLMNDNKPYQRYVDQGLFAVNEYCIRTVYGNMLKCTTLVTGKGQMILMEALQQEFGLLPAAERGA